MFFQKLAIPKYRDLFIPCLPHKYTNEALKGDVLSLLLEGQKGHIKLKYEIVTPQQASIAKQLLPIRIY